MVNSDALRVVVKQAAQLGLIEESILKELEEKAVQLSKDPSRLVAGVSSELSKMAENPQKYAEDLVQKMEEQALKMLDERLHKQFD